MLSPWQRTRLPTPSSRNIGGVNDVIFSLYWDGGAGGGGGGGRGEGTTSDVIFSQRQRSSDVIF